MTPSETVVAWLGGAGRWLWANRTEVGGLASTSFGIGWYFKWNHDARPEPTDPSNPAAWRRWRNRERFAFAVWERSGLVPKWLREASPAEAPPSRPPWERDAAAADRPAAPPFGPERKATIPWPPGPPSPPA